MLPRNIKMRTINDVTLYDLMSEDLDVWVCPDYKGFGFRIEIDNCEGEEIVSEGDVHPYAMDSFACFCRRYLASYDKYNKESKEC